MFARTRSGGHSLLIAAALICLLAPVASAGPIAVTDVLALPSNKPATAAAGPFPGNDTGAQSTLLNQLNGNGFTPLFTVSSGWSLVGKSDDANNGPFTSNPAVTAGTLTFDTPIDGPFAISLKAGPNFAVYFFDQSFSGVTGAQFSIAFLNNGGQTPDLSHASLFTAAGDGNEGGGGDPAPIPEPASLAVFGTLAACGALGLRFRRRATA